MESSLRLAGGHHPRERAIWKATQYRQTQLGDLCDRVLPLVPHDQNQCMKA